MTHLGKYETRIEENNSEPESVQGILIINYKRESPINSREAVQTQQIELARSLHILIVTTKTLLSLYEKFLKKS